jgi:hypothetical protein
VQGNAILQDPIKAGAPDPEQDKRSITAMEINSRVLKYFEMHQSSSYHQFIQKTLVRNEAIAAKPALKVFL